MNNYHMTLQTLSKEIYPLVNFFFIFRIWQLLANLKSENRKELKIIIKIKNLSGNVFLESIEEFFTNHIKE
jgi:hypothetical protein